MPPRLNVKLETLNVGLRLSSTIQGRASKPRRFEDSSFVGLRVFEAELRSFEN